MLRVLSRGREKNGNYVARWTCIKSSLNGYDVTWRPHLPKLEIAALCGPAAGVFACILQAPRPPEARAARAALRERPPAFLRG